MQVVIIFSNTQIRYLLFPETIDHFSLALHKKDNTDQYTGKLDKKLIYFDKLVLHY